MTAPQPDDVVPLTAQLAVARAAIARADRLLILTGAGISHASGVPTFRGAGGLWRQHRPETLATPEAFARDPRLTWEWYGWRRDLVAQCMPNDAHHAIARHARSRAGLTLVTQNVDGLHDRAAESAAGAAAPGTAAPAAGDHSRPAGGHSTSDGRPIALHGSIFSARCTACGVRQPLRDPIDASALATLPHCACGAMLRPDVVWFGESLDPERLGRAASAAADADVCLVIGTSGVVYPAAGLVDLAAQGGAFLIEVNPETTPVSAVADAHFAGNATDLVPALLA